MVGKVGIIDKVNARIIVVGFLCFVRQTLLFGEWGRYGLLLIKLNALVLFVLIKTCPN